ncbi:valacyclovir hydrolase-like [Ptychodera flava]|uniref:valacyclovir hydrolase-like n=1 Tax=Ptychodera flava TaxID=63121 RepID=UPI00396A8142
MATVCLVYRAIVVNNSLGRCGSLLRNFQRTTLRTLSSDVSQHYQEVNGVNIHYEKTGQGNHTLLLLPGALGSSQTDFSPQLSGLNRDKFTLIAWDPRGYGKSRPPDRDFPKKFFDRDAEDAAQLMKTLGYSKYSLLGWSDGGITALLIAARHSSALRKMVLWGGNSFVAEEDIKLYEATRDINDWSERMRTPMINMYGEEYFRKTWEAWVDGISRYWTEFEGDICKAELKNIKCPTLIVHGQKDPLVPQYHPDHLVANIKGSKLINWPDAKHNLHLRYADEFNKLVEDFLSQ